MSLLELRRQLFHLLLGVLIVSLLALGLVNSLHLFVLVVAGIAISLISRKKKIPLVFWFLERFEREKELKTFPGKGVVFYLIGAFLSVSLFSAEIAAASILILALGDSVSNIVGIRFGRSRHPLTDKKFLEGFLAGFLAAFIGALLFLPWYQALAASLASMAAEGLEIKLGAEQVDDNLVMPLVAGVAASVGGILL